tara:strand:+ start:860 stop:1015 length:156 start_codon:yes stop_codon:yes gene_type:complete
VIEKINAPNQGQKELLNRRPLIIEKRERKDNLLLREIINLKLNDYSTISVL